MTMLHPAWFELLLTWPLGVWIACALAALCLGLFLAGESPLYSLLVAAGMVLVFFAFVYLTTPHPGAA